MLADMRKRHPKTQPAREIVVEKEVDKPVVPSPSKPKSANAPAMDWITTIFGPGGAGLAALAGMDWQTVTAIGALALDGLVVVLLLRRQIICVVRDIRRMIEG